MRPVAERVIEMSRAGQPTRSIAAELDLTLGQVTGLIFRWREREGIAARQPAVRTVWTSTTISLLHQMRAAGYSANFARSSSSSAGLRFGLHSCSST